MPPTRVYKIKWFLLPNYFGMILQHSHPTLDSWSLSLYITETLWFILAALETLAASPLDHCHYQVENHELEGTSHSRPNSAQSGNISLPTIRIIQAFSWLRILTQLFLDPERDREKCDHPQPKVPTHFLPRSNHFPKMNDSLNIHSLQGKTPPPPTRLSSYPVTPTWQSPNSSISVPPQSLSVSSSSSSISLF